MGRRAALAAILVVAAALRAWLPFQHVFTEGFVNAQTSDAWYHLRIIDNLSANFPHALHVDPYAAAGGQTVPVATLFDVAVALVARLVAVGAPSPRTIDTVAVWMPVGLAVVVVALAFVIGRRLFDPLTGLVAAALLATMPGPFLDRTVLGYVDHHAAEACLSALVFLGLIWTLQRARDGARMEATAGRSALTGIALGAYLLTWTSSAFLVFILSAWCGVQYMLDAARQPAPHRPAIALVPMLASAAAILVLVEDPRVPMHGLRLLTLLAAAGGTLMLEGLSWLWRRRGWPASEFPAAAIACAAIVLGGAYFFLPDAWTVALDNLRRFVPDQTAQTVGEARSLVGPGAAVRAWAEFRSAFFLAVPGLFMLARDIGRRRTPERAALFVWTVVALAATVAQNRFGYYLALELAMVAAWLGVRVSRWAGAAGGVVRRSRLAADVAVVGVAVVIFYPNVVPALASVRHDLGVPVAWRGALSWMQTVTPDPFGDPSLYWSRDVDPVPSPSYTVMNWWDHGYWLIRLAHRVPVSNPTQFGAGTAARFYTETEPDQAMRILRETGARYITTGEEMPPRLITGQSVSERWFLAMPLWAGRDLDQYVWVPYRRSDNGAFVPVQVFTPEYYQSMMSRLYVFGGRAAVPANSTAVVSYRTRVPAAGGRPYDEITEVRPFPTYQEAETYLTSLGPGPHRLGGFDPLHTAVPLTTLDGVRLVYESPERSAAFPSLKAVRIFERQDPAS